MATPSAEREKKKSPKKVKKAKPFYHSSSLRKLLCPCIKWKKKKLRKKKGKAGATEVSPSPSRPTGTGESGDLEMVINPMRMTENPLALRGGAAERDRMAKDRGRSSSPDPRANPSSGSPEQSPSRKPFLSGADGADADADADATGGAAHESPYSHPHHHVSPPKDPASEGLHVPGEDETKGGDSAPTPAPAVGPAPDTPTRSRSLFGGMLGDVGSMLGLDFGGDGEEKTEGVAGKDKGKGEASAEGGDIDVGFTASKYGVLHRENELAQGNRNENPWLQVWACVFGRRLLYAAHKSPSLDSQQADGFLDISEHTSVKFTHFGDGNGADSRQSVGSYCFMVKNPIDNFGSPPVCVTFSAASEANRKQWVDALQQSIQVVSNSSDGAPLLTFKRDAGAESSMSAELPQKTGPLRKYAVGGFMGVKTSKKRWFQLVGGELRYYADEDMRPIKLKGTITLGGMRLLPPPGGDVDMSSSISIESHKNSGDKHIRLDIEAASPKEAKEWRAAIDETLVGLRVRSQGGRGARARQNISDIPGAGKSNHASDDDFNMSAWERMRSRLEAKTERVLTDVLKSHFLTKNVADPRELLSAFKPITKLPGDIIIAQGSPGDFFYVLEAGSASVLINDLKVAPLLAGRAFGDLALLTSSARTATVKAHTVCKLHTLDRLSLRRFLSKHEAIQLEEKMTFLENVKLFDKFNSSTLERIAEVMVLQSVPAGHTIFKKGDAGEAFYMVQKGKVSISLQSLTKRTELVRIGPGKYFGEVALLNNTPRSASAATLEKTTLWIVGRAHFQARVGSVQQARQESIGVEILKKVKLMQGLSDKQLIAVARCLAMVEFPQGVPIISQGEDGDTFYMVASGEVTVEVNHVVVASLGEGAFFGEASLMKNEKRSATVLAATDVTCLSISRANFVGPVLGPIAELVRSETAKRAAAEERANRGILDQVAEGISLFSSSELAQGLTRGNMPEKVNDGFFDLDQLDRVRLLGSGTYSSVYMVSHSQNDTFYALKVFHKEKLRRTHQEAAVFSERDIMRTFDSAWFPALYATFQDEGCLYMVQQLVPGGNLHSMLHSTSDDDAPPTTRVGGLLPETAAFFFANALTILTKLQGEDIVFRDLKPENFGLDGAGYLRLFDFGSAKVLPGDCTSNTMCGTPEYLSPEMITSKGHGRGTDVWSLGILLYELLTRKTPFHHPNSSMIYQQIMDSDEILRVSFCKGFDPDACNLIRALLVVNPHMRLGMLRNGIDDMWAHPFFVKHDLSAENVGRKRKVAPYKPLDVSLQRTELDDIIIGSFDTDTVPEYTGNYDFSMF